MNQREQMNARISRDPCPSVEGIAQLAEYAAMNLLAQAKQRGVDTERCAVTVNVTLTPWEDD